MSVLGTTQIYIKKGQKVTGLAVFGPDNKPCGGVAINHVVPIEGDTIQVEFLEKPE